METAKFDIKNRSKHKNSETQVETRFLNGDEKEEVRAQDDDAEPVSQIGGDATNNVQNIQINNCCQTAERPAAF